jgi:hypothetical protein
MDIFWHCNIRSIENKVNQNEKLQELSFYFWSYSEVPSKYLSNSWRPKRLSFTMYIIDMHMYIFCELILDIGAFTL